MAKASFRDVDHYISSFPPEVQAVLAKVRGAIRKAVPKAEESISYNMPAYRLGDWKLYFAGYKAHYSLFGVTEATRRAFQPEVAEHEQEKGTLQFPYGERVPVGLIGKLAKHGAKAGKARNTYAVLLRGINVGGKNLLSMAALAKHLEELGFSNVSTLIASGNVILDSDQPPEAIKAQIEAALPKRFKLDSDLIKVLVLSRSQLQRIVDRKPKGFGDQPEKYHSDAIFLIGIDPTQALAGFTPREGVDTVWAGDGVIYAQRLSSQRTQSRLNKIVGTPAYKSMTIRNWATTTKLLKRMDP